MTSEEIRKKYIEFFRNRGHEVIPSASLVPENDPTVLFTTAGMHPLVPYLLGQEYPSGNKRLVNYQKCVRTGDIDEVGDDVHLTFFEMLGNWSLGDYFKDEAIKYSWEFLTDKKTGLGIDPKFLAVSCFAGDEEMGIEKDEETAKIWRELGVKEDRIAFLGKKDNWWGPAGQTGPCGPDTEMFYWNGEGDAPDRFDPSDKRWVEIWNDVFMEYNKTSDGKFEPLANKNVDTGMGLERITAMLSNKKSVYDTELFSPVIKKFKELSDEENELAARIVADHVKASVFIISDEVRPSNLDRGYVLRRLIRRAVRQGRTVNAKSDFLQLLADVVIKIYREYYPSLDEKKEEIISVIAEEVHKFEATLEKGMREFEKILVKDIVSETISGQDAFNLFSTYGFPLELTEEMAKEKGISVDDRSFWQEFEKHQEKSRSATAGTFKGGLADHSDKVVRLHTVTHLLQAALRRVLGEEIYQRGSNITKDRTRFDFSYPEKMTAEQLSEVERWVNQWIDKDLLVEKEIMTPDQAREKGAIGLFGEKYGDKVSIYTIRDRNTGEVVSREFCGGPHVEYTKEIGKFRIKKEESSSSGVRRIKGVVE